MISFIQRLRYRLPKYHRDVWYNLHAHSRDSYPIIFDKNGDYIDCKIGLRVVYGKISEDRYAVYKIISISSRRGDWLYDSDKYRCDLKFVGIYPKEKLNIQKN